MLEVPKLQGEIGESSHLAIMKEGQQPILHEIYTSQTESTMKLGTARNSDE